MKSRLCYNNLLRCVFIIIYMYISTYGINRILHIYNQKKKAFFKKIFLMRYEIQLIFVFRLKMCSNKFSILTRLSDGCQKKKKNYKKFENSLLPRSFIFKQSHFSAIYFT